MKVSAFEYAPLNGEESVQAEEEIENILWEAKTSAELIIQQAQREAEDIKEKAFQAGYAEGKEKAIKEARKAIESISQLFSKGLEDIASLKSSILEKAEDGIIQLSIAIAKKLVASELKQHPDTIVNIVQSAISLITERSKIMIRIHPDDRLLIEQYADELRKYLNNESAQISISEDPNLTPGGCIITTDTNILDATFESRMSAIEDNLRHQKGRD